MSDDATHTAIIREVLVCHASSVHIYMCTHRCLQEVFTDDLQSVMTLTSNSIHLYLTIYLSISQTGINIMTVTSYTFHVLL